MSGQASQCHQTLRLDLLSHTPGFPLYPSQSWLRYAWISASIWPVVSYEFQWVWANKYSPFQWNPQLTTGLPVFKRSHLSKAHHFGYIQPLVFGGVTLPLFHKSTIPCFVCTLLGKLKVLLIKTNLLTAGSAPPEIPKLEDHHFQVPCGCFQE